MIKNNIKWVSQEGEKKRDQRLNLTKPTKKKQMNES